MRLLRARVRNYRSIRDSGWFEVEPGKTILVGPNEAGKTALFYALQSLNPPEGERDLVPLRDYPRSDYAKIQRQQIAPRDVTVAEAIFELDDMERAALAEIDEELAAAESISVTRRLDNTRLVTFSGIPEGLPWKTYSADFKRLRT
jgi:predicted ATP-dependent endonuclease of OLD family